MSTVKDILSELKWLILFCVLAIIGVCMYRYAERYVFVDIPSEIVGYLEEKYSEDDFQFVKFEKSKNTVQSKSAIVKGKEGTEFLVTRRYLDNGDVEYIDNYVGVECLEYINEQLSINMPEGATYTVSINDSVFANSEKGSIDVAEILNNLDTVVSVSLKDTHTWSMEEVEKFCKSLPFRVNVVLVSDGVQMHFSTIREYGVVYR